MNQKKPKIILCGESVVINKELIQALQEFADVKLIINYFDLIKHKMTEDEKLIVWELSKVSRKRLKSIATIKKRQPSIEIVIINGGGGTKIAADILKAGASDIFPKPFDLDLLIDRIGALIRLNKKN